MNTAQKTKKTIWKITCQKAGKKETYYEPEKLPEWAKDILSNKGWKVTERRISVETELAKMNPAKWGRQAASLRGVSSASYAFDIAEGIAQERVSAINNAANGNGSLLS